MSQRAQEKALKKRQQMKEEAAENQHERQKEQLELQQAFNQQGELSRGWMREVLGVDDLEDRLQENTIRKLQAMFNKQWILSNLTDAETHDRQFWLEAHRYKLLGEHPPEGSIIQGPIRAHLLDDEWADLQALTPQERNEIDQIIQGLKNMVTRSRGGFEREQTNTSIARTESETEDSDDSGGFTGLFS